MNLPPHTSKPLLSLVDLKFQRHNRWVLQGVDLSISSGETVCMTGPNGAGKSTLLQVANGEITALGGTIVSRPDVRRFFVSNERLNSWSEFQVTAVLDLITHHRAEDAHMVPSPAQLMRRYELGPAQTVGTLSGGQLRRFVLMLAEASTAQIVLLDEPTAGLDSNGRVLVEDYLERLTESGGGALIATTDADLVVRLTMASIYALADGELTQVRAAAKDCPLT